jgi:hypothetical protein
LRAFEIGRRDVGRRAGRRRRRAGPPGGRSRPKRS